MLTTLSIGFYFLVFLFLAYFLLPKKEISLSVEELVLALAGKVALACLYGYIFLRFYSGDDTWAFHQQGLKEYEKMWFQTGQFFRDLLPAAAFAESDGWWQGIVNYLRHLEYYTFHKLLAVFNLLSGGNYYINTVFFSFITFWGHYWLFKIMVTEFPGKRRVLYLFIFLFPPVVFWLSGIRTDGIIFFFLMLALVYFSQWLKTGKTSAALYCLLGLAGVLIYRNMLLLLLIPSLLAWFITARYKTKPVVTYLMMFGISTIVFFGTTLLSSSNNLPGIVAKRQQLFFELTGNTRFALDSLQPNVSSYVRVLPQSVNNTFFRPYPWEADGPLQIVTSLDIILFWLLVVMSIAWKDKPWKEFFKNPLILFLLFFGVSLYLFTGYTVPFPGAIVRYKCIPELMLLLVFVTNIRWLKMV